MAGGSIPHFQNDAGHAAIDIGVKEFMCVGANPPFDHPHVFLDMGADDEKVCPYCSTLYRFDPALKPTETGPKAASICIARPDREPSGGHAMSEARSRQIIVAGAGIAGLTAALAFAARGFPVRVFERAPRLDEIGAGIQLSPNATRILDRLGVLPALRPPPCGPTAVVLRDAAKLAELARVPLGAAAERRWGAPYLVVHRADLQSALLAHVAREPGIQLVTGARVRDVGLHAAWRHRLGRRRPVAPAVPTGCCSSAPTASGRRCAASPAAPARAAFPASSPGAGRSAPKARPDNRLSEIGAAGAVTAFLHPGFHLVAYPVRGGNALNLVAFTAARQSAESWSGKADIAVLQDGHARVRRQLLARLADDGGAWTVWPIHTVDLDEALDRAGRHRADRRRRARHDALRRPGCGDGDRGCRNARRPRVLPSLTARQRRSPLGKRSGGRASNASRAAARSTASPGMRPGRSPWRATCFSGRARPESSLPISTGSMAGNRLALKA